MAVIWITIFLILINFKNDNVYDTVNLSGCPRISCCSKPSAVFSLFRMHSTCNKLQFRRFFYETTSNSLCGHRFPSFSLPLAGKVID